MSESPISSWQERDGTLLRLRLARPKANVIDREMMRHLRQALDAHLDQPDLKAVLIDHQGPNFSFGASIEEHMPELLMDMLEELHLLLKKILQYPAPVLMSVRGKCLGGGLELAASGSLIFAADDAIFSQPEIQLAGFAPAASCILPERIGQARAEDLLLSGRAINAQEALQIGLVQQVAPDPEEAALTWVDAHLAQKSAAALRLALKASRAAFAQRVIERFADAEALCAQDLLATADMTEGMTAFLEKRAPVWRHC